MNRLLHTFLLMFVTVSLFAVPAKRGIWRQLRLTDGATVRAELFGDERFHYWVGEDKSFYTRQGTAYQRVDRDRLRSRIAEAQRQFDAGPAADARRAQGRARKAAAYTGNKKSLILLVEFSDMPFSMDDPKAFYNRVANEKGFSEGNFRGSITDYFSEQSNGQFNLQFDVVGPYTLGPYATYGSNNASGGVDTQKAQLMVTQACAAAEREGVNFRQYDWNGDGVVEEVYVLYAGKGEADGGDENTVWPHKSQIPATTYGNAIVEVYACSNEINGSGAVAGIGTICHEFSHCLGYPDMYDIDYDTNGRQYGMGTWDLMCSGSYNGGGYVPAGYTAYEKMVAGWITPVDVSQEERLSVSDWTSVAKGGNAYIMYNPGNADEYYIWENRQQDGFNASLPASGIMIYHIDYDAYVWSRNRPNTIGSINDHERITFIPADNSRTENTESGDTWPYASNNTLSNGSRPAAEVFSVNTSTNTRFMNIALSNMAVTEDGLASFNFSNLNLSSGGGDNTFQETFDKCAGTGGNDGVFTQSGMQTIASADFTPDNSGWSTDNAFGGNMCARFGTSSGRFGTGTITPGVAVTPAFTLKGKTTLSFKAAPFGSDGTTLTVTATGGTLGQESFTMTAGEWTTFTTQLTADGDVTLTFSGAGRFFLDDVVVGKTETPTAIDVVAAETEAAAGDGYTYNLAGQRVDKSYRGVVIRNGRKYVQR